MRIPNVELSCPTCDHWGETDMHCFFRCNLARGIWFHMLGLRVENVGITTLEGWLIFLFKHHKGKIWNGWEIDKMAAIVLNQIWDARNVSWVTPVTKKDPYRMSKLINQIKELYWEQDSTSNQTEQTEYKTPPRTSWIPPEKLFLKYNTDASIKGKGVEVAVIVRNSDKKLVVGERKYYDNKEEGIEEAELSAIEMAVANAKKLGCTKISVEGDCQVVVNACNNPTLAHWKWRSRAEAVNLWLNQNPFCSIVYVSRDSNRAAHEAANFSRLQKFSGHFDPHCLPLNVRKAVELDSFGSLGA